MTDTATTEAEAPAEEAPKRSRGEALQETRTSKLKEFFEGRKFEFVKEIKLEGDARFETPFGNKGRNGYAYKQVGGPDLDTELPGVTKSKDGSATFIIGETLAKNVAEQFGSLTVPEKERKRRTKEQKEADDKRIAEEKAAAKAAKDAEAQAAVDA